MYVKLYKKHFVWSNNVIRLTCKDCYNYQTVSKQNLQFKFTMVKCLGTGIK